MSAGADASSTSNFVVTGTDFVTEPPAVTEVVASPRIDQLVSAQSPVVAPVSASATSMSPFCEQTGDDGDHSGLTLSLLSAGPTGALRPDVVFRSVTSARKVLLTVTNPGLAFSMLDVVLTVIADTTTVKV